MQGIRLPDRTEDFTADPVELFFDLAYVLAYSQLVSLLVHHPTWEEAGRVALLFALMWLPWSQVTWAANAVSGNGRRPRLLFLVATAVSVAMASSVSTAFGDSGLLFALSCTGIVAIGFLANRLAFDPGEAELRSATRWFVTNCVGLVLLISGALVDGDLRIALWVGTVAVTAVAMVQAGSGEWVIRPGHMAERHGLIVIIALGEIIVAVGLPVLESFEAGESLSTGAVVALVASASIACLFWWGYFDRVQPALEHHAESLTTPKERGRFARDGYTAAHLLIVGGIITTAAGLEEVALHPDDPIPTAFQVMLGGGIALTTLGVVVAIGRAYRVIARERFVAIAGVVAVLAATSSLDGAVVLVIVFLGLAATLLLEHLRIEH